MGEKTSCIFSPPATKDIFTVDKLLLPLLIPIYYRYNAKQHSNSRYAQSPLRSFPNFFSIFGDLHCHSRRLDFLWMEEVFSDVVYFIQVVAPPLQQTSISFFSLFYIFIGDRAFLFKLAAHREHFVDCRAAHSASKWHDWSPKDLVVYSKAGQFPLPSRACNHSIGPVE